MCDEQGNYIFYKVYEPNLGLELNIKFEYKENAEKCVEFLHREHRVKCKIKKMLMCIGVPDYEDEKVLEAIKCIMI